MREMVGGCCVCSDDRGWSENPLVYCDGQSCTVAVHQACYGIVSVPTGPWYCRKCESQERAAKVKCELCPSRYGALKRTDNAGWAHVVCALYIPEVRFGNVTTMEPIQLQLIPAERFNKVCYICEEKGKPANASVGACMQCNRAGCKQQFHVTCAQSLGLLCEEAGNYLDNVKYCGYCQHHYSKLKKGGNVKTIPPYKPVSSENHLSDSSSEKEVEGSLPPPPPVTTSTSSSKTAPSSTSTLSTTTSSSSSSSSSKRKSTSGTKSSNSSKSGGSTTKSSSSSPNNSKTSSSSSHHNSKSSDKKVNSSSSSSSRGAKNAEEHAETGSDAKDKRDKSEHAEESKSELKESKGSKKRKAHSRTPTPVSTIVSSDSTVSVVVNSHIQASSIVSSGDRSVDSTEASEKIKKAKVETTQSIISNQPIVALTSLSTIKLTPARSATPLETTSDTSGNSTALTTTQSIIQSTTTSVNSLVVSVPLSSTSLSPHHQLGNSQSSSVLLPGIIGPMQEKNSSVALSGEDLSNNLDSLNLGGDQSASDMGGGGLKITYEKQEASTINTTEEDMELEEITTEVPAKRTRSQSNDKTEKQPVSSGGRGKKRNSGNGALGSTNSNSSVQLNNNSNSSYSSHSVRRGGVRSQLNVSPTPQTSSSQNRQPGAFSSISQNQLQLKNSPPSSPSSESLGAAPSTSRGKTKSRKSAPASIITPGSSRDSKDVKLFQNGVTAPHMLGNQLNPTSNMAQKMSDHLNSELEAHSIFNPNENANLMGPQLHQRVVQTARSNSTGSTASGNSGLSGMLSGGGGNIPQTLDQLLERQWEQGSQFLMEQAQHFDIASLLSCLHQLRAENLRLEEHVSSLLQRRDHLLAVNARLAIPLTGQPATPQSTHPHTVNNIHPAVAAGHSDIPRSRHSTGSASYPAHPQGSSADVPVENGLLPDPSQAYSTHHRSPAPGQPQRSPTVRASSAGSSYSSNTLVRQGADTSGRSAPRPQPYTHYQGPGTSSSQQQMVIRRDEVHHQSSKPS